MTRVWTISIALCLGAFGLAGCPEEETPEDELQSRLDDYAAELNNQAEVFCDCWEPFSYESRGACQEANGEILPAKRRCYDDAFKRDVAASNQWIECVMPLEVEFTSCLNDRLDCDEGTDSYAACNSDYSTGRENCIDLPGAIERAIEDCNN